MRTGIPLFTLLAAGIAFAAPDFPELIHTGQTALAKSDIPAAAESFAAACDSKPATPDRQASCEHHLALIDEARGDVSHAESRLLGALSDWKKAGDSFRGAYITSLMNLGEICRRQRRFDEAGKYLQTALDLARDARPQYPQLYPIALSRMGGFYASSDRPEQARSRVTEAIGLLRALKPLQDVETARALDALGIIDLSEGQAGAAAAVLGEAVALSISSSGDEHPLTAAYQCDLALAYIRTRQFSRAEPLLKRARYVVEKKPGADKLRLGVILSELSITACGEGRYSLAEEYAAQALAILTREPVAGLLARVNLGAAWLSEHKVAEAERILSAAVCDERILVPHTFLLADGLHEMATLRAAQRSWKEAAALYRESIDIYQDRLGPGYPGIAPLFREYAEVLRHDPSLKAEAKAAELKARALRHA